MREETIIQAVNDIDTIARLTEDLHQQHFINEPDYWDKLKHQYAGMILAGMLANSEWEGTYERLSECAIEAANTLIEKLKNEK